MQNKILTYGTMLYLNSFYILASKIKLSNKPEIFSPDCILNIFRIVGEIFYYITSLGK